MNDTLTVRVQPSTRAACPTCGEPVIAAYRYDQTPVMLDPTPVSQGVYAFDRVNRAARRPLRELVAEGDGSMCRGGGYQPHACTAPRPWYDR